MDCFSIMSGSAQTLITDPFTLTSPRICPIFNASDPINQNCNVMHIKTFSIKGFLILALLAGLTTFLLTAISFAREPIRTVTGTVTKVSDGDTIHVTTSEKTKLTVRLYGMDAPETPKINQRTAHINKPGYPKLEKGGCYTAHNVSSRGRGMGGTKEFYDHIKNLPDMKTRVDESGGGISISYKQ
jgi:hypothetical protein